MEVDGKKEIKEDQEEEWAVECSDEENYKIGRDDIIEFYTRIANGEALELEWKCPGRRSPTPEPNTENVEEAEVVNREPVTEQKWDFECGYVFYELQLRLLLPVIGLIDWCDIRSFWWA